MKTDTLVTLGNGKKYYLVEETIQDNTKYFMATLFDENNYPTEKSAILEEIDSKEGTRLNEVEDPELINKLAAIFVMNLNETLTDDKEEEE